MEEARAAQRARGHLAAVTADREHQRALKAARAELDQALAHWDTRTGRTRADPA
ncbi:hypothetical protein [Streptomyces sp. NPDC020965]|uniref:hypothetical protein n=1 Tax=Streptomyces sp. NPDC020965 TaxID=3365105 RepID=UPI0037B245FF